MKDKRIAIIILGIVITLAFFGLLGLLVFQGIPEQNGELLYLAVGALIAGFSTVVSYFFGSSAGSAEKNDMLKQK